MQFQSIFSLLFLAAPIVHAVALPTDGFDNKVEVRAGNAALLANEHTRACNAYRNCIKGCETSSGYKTATGVLKSSAKKSLYKKCLDINKCSSKEREAETLLQEWKKVSDAAKSC